MKGEQEIDLYCVCRLPEDDGVPMAQCDGCEMWYHKHCLDIPDDVFDSTDDLPWLCASCNSPACSVVYEYGSI